LERRGVLKKRGKYYEKNYNYFKLDYPDGGIF
jgi:hypothetical protein